MSTPWATTRQRRTKLDDGTPDRLHHPPEVLTRSFASPLGTATGAERLQIRLADLLTHGWDLSQTTAIPITFPDELTEQALAFSRDQYSSGPS